MLKKALIVGIGLMLLAMLFFGAEAVSYIKTGVSRVHDTVKSNVPIEFEIDRARKMIKELDPEIAKNMKAIAREEVEVAKLERDIDARETQLAKNLNDIERLRGDLKSDSEFYVYAGRSYPAAAVERDLARRWKNFTTMKQTAENHQRVLQARHSKLEAARQELESMMAAQKKLEITVENLEARQKMVEVAQATSEFNFDDSKLARTRELIDEIGTRLEVSEKLLHTNVELHDSIPLDEPESSEDVLEEIDRYLGKTDSLDFAYSRSNN